MKKKRARDPIDEFLNLRRKLPKISDKKILAAIRKGGCKLYDDKRKS